MHKLLANLLFGLANASINFVESNNPDSHERRAAPEPVVVEFDSLSECEEAQRILREFEQLLGMQYVSTVDGNKLSIKAFDDKESPIAKNLSQEIKPDRKLVEVTEGEVLLGDMIYLNTAGRETNFEANDKYIGARIPQDLNNNSIQSTKVFRYV